MERKLKKELSIFKITISIFLIIIITSCKGKVNTKKDNNNTFKIINCEESLWNDILAIREKIFKESKLPKKEIIENFEELNDFVFKFYALKGIHNDSLEMHAPLDGVNILVDEYNTFCNKNIKIKGWRKINHFGHVNEYKSNKNNICLIMENEILLYKGFGYTLEKNQNLSAVRE